MFDPDSMVTLSLAALTGTAMVVTATLAGWRGWLQLKAKELDRLPDLTPPAGAGARIEIADLRERIRKLEAIAAGVEL